MAFELRKYQDDISTKGAEILRAFNILYLAMEVRVGKTFTMFATCVKFGAVNALVITKKKAIQSILNDFETMFNTGGDMPELSCYVINFESLHKIGNYVFDIVVIDEADSLGQFPKPSARVEAIKKICGLKPIIYMSGTPHPESPSQLYHQFYVSAYSPWSEFKSFYSWAREGYVQVAKRFIKNKEFNDYSDADNERIVRDTSKYFITYSQEDAGFKQSVQEITHWVQMQPGTYRLADTILKDRIYTGRNGEVIIADEAVKVQQKLHQIYSGTVKLEPERVQLPNGEYTIAEPKAIIFDRSKVKYILDNFAGKKLAIFYKFVAEGVMLKEGFEGCWTDSPEEFNASDDLNFICQISSGKQGVNLSTADLQIMFNPDFSANSYWQGRARQVTKDREKPVFVIWLLSVGGIEAKIYESVMNKKDYTLQFFKRDFMPWLKSEKVLLTRIQQIEEINRAEAKANGNQLSLPLPAPQPQQVQKEIVINNIFEDPFK